MSVHDFRSSNLIDRSDSLEDEDSSKDDDNLVMVSPTLSGGVYGL